MITALLIFLAMFFYVAGAMVMSLWLYDQSGLRVSEIIWSQLAILVWPGLAVVILIVLAAIGILTLVQQRTDLR